MTYRKHISDHHQSPAIGLHTMYLVYDPRTGYTLGQCATHHAAALSLCDRTAGPARAALRTSVTLTQGLVAL